MSYQSTIPIGLQRLSALVAFAECAFLLAWQSRITVRAAADTNLTDREQSSSSTLATAFFAVWFAVALVVADSANFPLKHPELRTPYSGLVSLVPFLAALVWLFGSRRGRSINSATDPASLISVQFYRIAGGLFLFPFLYYGSLPATFAWCAGIGDMLTGLFAPVVAWSLSRNHRGSYGLAVVWNFFGMLDLIVAPATAVASGAHILEMYPLSMIPLFVGPPIGMLIHISSLRNLSVNRERLLSRPRLDP